jgi:aspartyl-tRNA(Asn)/glutamyl-tRNA(Gln) amidotransferase subunit C
MKRQRRPYSLEFAMSVDAATVKRIGRLARIRIEEEEVAGYQAEINAILGFVEQLGEVNVDGVEPMTSVTPMQLRRRDDVVTDGGYPERIVKNAPLTEDNFFMVPKVVE